MKKCAKPVDVSGTIFCMDFKSGLFGVRYTDSWQVRVSFNDFDKNKNRLPLVLCGHVFEKNTGNNQLCVTYEFRDCLLGKGDFLASRFKKRMSKQIERQK